MRFPKPSVVVKPSGLHKLCMVRGSLGDVGVKGVGLKDYRGFRTWGFIDLCSFEILGCRTSVGFGIRLRRHGEMRLAFPRLKLTV